MMKTTIIIDGKAHTTRVLGKIPSLWGGVLYLVRIKGELAAVDAEGRPVNDVTYDNLRKSSKAGARDAPLAEGLLRDEIARFPDEGHPVRDKG